MFQDNVKETLQQTSHPSSSFTSRPRMENIGLFTNYCYSDLHEFVPQSNGEEREKRDRYGVTNWRPTKALRNMDRYSGLEHTETCNWSHVVVVLFIHTSNLGSTVKLHDANGNGSLICEHRTENRKEKEQIDEIEFSSGEFEQLTAQVQVFPK